jgi:hypothetical protein
MKQLPGRDARTPWTHWWAARNIAGINYHTGTGAGMNGKYKGPIYTSFLGLPDDAWRQLRLLQKDQDIAAKTDITLGGASIDSLGNWPGRWGDTGNECRPDYRADSGCLGDNFEIHPGRVMDKLPHG